MAGQPPATAGTMLTTWPSSTAVSTTKMGMTTAGTAPPRTGGRAVSGVEGATTWWPGGDADTYGGLLRDIEEGYAKSVAIVVPPGAVWPLPAYELALMTVGEAREMGQEDVHVIVVTPEHAPLSLFGEDASRAVAEELQWAGIELRTGTVVQNASELDVQRVFAVPRIVGTIIAL